ncbi:type II CRISPR RNA-guided endonuclease Cas9 [Eilatimonas milleporae]|nr:type II CRISPR RNA-guided endonuclease Cas9 [Eilatimonas milleporae]
MPQIQQTKPDYRLALDLGANSIGWALIALDGDGRGTGFVDGGVRLFSTSELAGRDPKTKTSLAVARRLARSARRRRDRYLDRRGRLLAALVDHGLLPEDTGTRKKLADLDPYRLRAEGLDRPLHPHELGRAIFHINQRRGFKSNRKTDGGDDGQDGKIRAGTRRLRDAMADTGARTLGAYLHARKARGQWVRARPQDLPAGDGKRDSGYDMYPDRSLYIDEFNALWAAQAPHHPGLLSAALKETLFDLIFYQRPLRRVSGGRCPFHTEEERLPRAHPLSQRLRIYQELNALRLQSPDAPERALSLEERDIFAAKLLGGTKLTFDQIRKRLKLPPGSTLNFERGDRDYLKPDETAARLKAAKAWGKGWTALPLDDQIAIVERLDREQDEAALIRWLTDTWGLETAGAVTVARTLLPAGHAGLGPTAARRILAELEAGVHVYSTAAAQAGYHHSDFRTGEIRDALPYYGEVLDRHVAFGSGDADDPPEKRFGRIANPTVHIALGQVRRLVNRLIRRHGRPAEIIIEVARELKLNEKQRRDWERKRREGQARNDRYRETFAQHGIADTGANRMKMRLWEELNPKDPLDRRCVFSGEVIGLSRLFSDAVEVEHLIPFSRSLDDSPANKTVSLRTWNRRKGNMTPHVAFGEKEYWPDIASRARALPPAKRARFAPDAAEKFEESGGFLARHLNDTKYLSRIAREYVGVVCGGGPDAVWVTPGSLVAMLRGKWGLNSLLSDHNLKTRVDHRHHLIDAAVIGAVDRSLLQRMSRAAARAETHQLDALMETVPTPWPTFRADLDALKDRVTVSHRPDHGLSKGAGRGSGKGSGKGTGATTDKLHNDTAYGLARYDAAGDRWTVVTRKALDAFTGAGDVAAVRDPRLRAGLTAATEGLDKKAFAAARDAWGRAAGVRRLRVEETLSGPSLVPVRDADGRAYKAYKGDSNHCIDIWRLPDGRWDSRVVTTFAVNQPGYADRRPHPAAKRMMRLHKDDMVAVDMDGGRAILRVVKFSGKTVVLAPHHEGGALKARDADRDDPFRYVSRTAGGLAKLGARQVRVDETGRVFDPGAFAPARAGRKQAEKLAEGQAKEQAGKQAGQSG